jgi:transposase
MGARAGGAIDPIVNEAVKAVVVDRLRRGPGPAARHALAAPPAGPPPSRWSLRALRATFPWWEGLTLSGVWRALRRLGLGLRAAAVQRYSPDPDYLAKEARLRACLRAAAATPDAVAALFLDETGYARWPDPGADWGLVAPAPRPVAGRAGSKQRLWRVLGALNALTGQVDYLDAYVVGREKVSAFYRQLDRRYAALRRLYVIQDNWSIHRHPDVLATLETLPRLEPVWLPTYAPWLNPVEKLWRWLKEQVLKQHRLAGDWPALRQRVRAFLDQFTTGGSAAGHALLQYVGLRGEGTLAQACRAA